MSKASFFTNGDGKWSKTTWPDQCKEKVFLTGKCQGLSGHKGVHWCFNPSGWFCWSDNKENPIKDGCSGSTPPGHVLYRHPLEMQEFHWRNFYTKEEVTDPKEIERLEKGIIGDDETIDRPCALTSQQIERIRDRYLCERCGGTGHQEAGCWDGKAYNAPAGVCDTCKGEGYLGKIERFKEN